MLKITDLATLLQPWLLLFGVKMVFFTAKDYE